MKACLDLLRGWVWCVGVLLIVALPVPLYADILIVSPHPDDDVIIAAGVVQRAVQRGEIVRIVFVTNGDYNGLSLGTLRQGEAVNGQAALGVPENRLIFMGYPDGALNTIRVGYTTPGSAFTTHNGINSTYASRGLGGTDYHRHRFGSAGLYNWPTMVGDLADIISSTRPSHIFTTSQWDTHSDHSTVYQLVVQSALNAITANPGYNPTIHKTTVWPGGDPTWPGPADQLSYFREIPRDFVTDPTQMVWSERESLDVPSSSQAPLAPGNPKYMSIAAHESQGGRDRYISLWVHKDEFFWTEQLTGSNRPPVPNAGPDQEVDEAFVVTLDGRGSWDRNGNPVTYQWRQVVGPTVTLTNPTSSQPTFLAPSGLAVDTALEFELVVSDGSLTSVPDGVRVVVRSALRPPTFGPNVAPLASFNASTERTAAGAGAAKVADGFVDGYPGDGTREWVTQNEGAGAWIQMTWPSPRTLGKVVLHDRPNPDDQALAGVISFSDGSTLAIGPLSNNAGPVTYTFPARPVTWLRFTITQVSVTTGNVGMAEFEVYEAGTTNLPPVANAGPDQTAGGGQAVTLNGAQSTDPNHDPLTFTWTQTSGAAVTLSNATSATPSFVAPPAQPLSQTLRFSLVVSDGELTSSADTVEVRVPGTANGPPTANAGPDVTVSPGGAVTLNGSGSSDPEGQTLTYQWTQTGGTPATLSSATAVSPSFVVPPTTPEGSTLTFQLVVSDGTDPSIPDTVVVNASTVPDAINNIAPSAILITASTENAPLQAATKAVDRVTSGYPVDSSREWATTAQGIGAWIELRWAEPHSVGLIRLHDRPNSDDHVRSGTLTFSDGSSVAVGVLANDGSGTDIQFAPRQITWVRFTIDTVGGGTYSIGLSEILVLETPSGGNQPPVAEAGANQNVAGGASVQLNGGGSSDPEGATLTYSWTQTLGPAVTIVNPTSATPTFTAPAATEQQQVLRFQLVVSDGTLTSSDTTDVTVAAATPSTLSVNDVTVTEGNGGAVNAVFTVTLSSSSTQTVTVNYATGVGTATAGQDYTAGSSTLSFSPGTTSQTVSIPILGDTLDEPNETFFVTLSGAVNATIADAQGVGTITDDDPTPTIAIGDIAVTEGNVGTVSAIFAVTLSAASAQTITVNYATANSTATAPQDYTAIATTTLTFAPGTTAQTVTVTVQGDTLVEPTETFFVNLTSPTNATIADAQGLGTIQDDEAVPSFSISDVTVTETNAAGLNAVFTVTLSLPSAATVSVTYATANNTATAPADYTAAAATVLSFAAGTTSQTISVPIAGDLVNELSETFFVNLTSPVNANITDGQGIGTIVDNDALPAITINNATVTEGDTANVNAVFTVTLSAASAQTVTVNYVTANDTAAATTDYTAASGTLTFAPGTTSQTVTIVTLFDTVDEANETFFVNLSGAVNATVADAQGLGTITDNDATPAVAITDVSVTEGNTGTVNAVFTVSLSAASAQTVTVNCASANGTATSPQDYVAISTTTLTFAPGSTSRTITVVVQGDLLDEPNETFFVNLTTPTNATIADAQGLGTILDDEPLPSIAIGNVSVTETNAAGVNAVFTVTLSAASASTVSVTYATANNTAAAPADYTAAAATVLSFTPGTTSRTISIPIAGDLLDELDETFFVNLTTPVNATMADNQAVGTIVDNDAAALAVNNVTVTEGNTANVNAVFTVTLSAASAQTVTVNYVTANGTAAAAADYTAASGTLTFAPGTTSQTVTIVTLFDTRDEANETFFVNLGGAVNATIADAQGLGTINDNDATPSLRINNVTVTEGNTGATANATFTITLSAASSFAVSVNVATSNNTALAGQDYTSVSGTVTLPAGTTTQTVVVPVLGDVLDEATETYNVNLTAPVNATIADNLGVGTISDNDPTPTLVINNVSIVEPDSGQTNLVFTVTLSAASGRSVAVNYATANGTATAGSDFTTTSGTLTFAAGVTTMTISVPILGNVTAEPNETFVVNLSGASNATIADSQGTGTILNDD